MLNIQYINCSAFLRHIHTFHIIATQLSDIWKCSVRCIQISQWIWINTRNNKLIACYPVIIFIICTYNSKAGTKIGPQPCKKQTAYAEMYSNAIAHWHSTLAVCIRTHITLSPLFIFVICLFVWAIWCSRRWLPAFLHCQPDSQLRHHDEQKAIFVYKKNTHTHRTLSSVCNVRMGIEYYWKKKTW